MSGLSENEQKILAKFTIANNLSSFSIYHNTKMDLLFEFISPMSKPNESLKEEANKLTQDADLIYTENKIIHHRSGSSIIIFEGNRIRICLIINSEGIKETNTVEFLLNMVEDFSELFEGNFGKILKEFEGDTTVFGDLAKLFEKELSFDLSLPHYAKYVGFDPEKKIEQYVFGAADQLSRKIGYFYLPNLLYAAKKYVVDSAIEIVENEPKRAKKEKIDPKNIKFPPNDKFRIAMFNLRTSGMLVPISIGELASFSKIKYPKTN